MACRMPSASERARTSPPSEAHTRSQAERSSSVSFVAAWHFRLVSLVGFLVPMSAKVKLVDRRARGLRLILMKTLAPIIDSQFKTKRTYQPRIKRTFKDRGVTIEIEGPADAVREQERLLRAEKTTTTKGGA